MSACPVCGDTNYECISGLYYCTTCQTQSQSVIEMAIDDYYYRHYKYSKKIRKDNLAKAEKYGRLWTTSEGFQFIIKEQVKALIDLGANPKLKDIVFDIWARYLSKTGVAFCREDASKKPQIYTCLTRSRDAHIATSKDPFIKPLMRHKKVEDSTKKLYGNRRTAVSQYRHLERMSMVKTISFCYLGLLYTNNLTTLSDIIRWINMEKIPYMNASNLFPENIKFFAEDTLTFNSPNVPSCRNIRKICGLLVAFLDLSDLPSVPIMDLANKYLCQLDLPGELHGILNNLTNNTPDIWVNAKRNRILPPYECIAMAYIVVLLKILFGLDDATERNLSNFAKVYSSYTAGEQKMFIWDDWVAHISRKVANMKRYREALEQNQPFIVQDLQQFLSYCEKMSRSNTRISILKERAMRKEDHCNSIKRIFNLITDRLKESNPNLEENLPSTPLESTNLFNNSTSQPNGSQGIQFRKASVRFITHPETFLHMNPFNISDSTIQSIHSHSEGSDDEDLFTSASSAEDSCSSGKKKWGRIRHVVVRRLQGAKRQKIDLASQKKLRRLLLSSYKNYVKLPDKTIPPDAIKQKNIPFTYLWLLYICSLVIEETCPMLDCQVKNIEGLKNIRKISKFRNGSLRHMRTYFKKPA